MEHDNLSGGVEFSKALLGAAEEYAIECSIVKVLALEVLDFIVDENVQIHGGMGLKKLRSIVHIEIRELPEYMKVRTKSTVYCR